jgi:putative PIN family toxin of toxin-antitoxin system
MRKVVFDTNILVSALWTPGGNPAKIIALMPCGQLIPCYSHPIMQEYSGVLYRPKLKFSGSKTKKILMDIAKYGLSVIPVTSIIPLPDESDRKFYDAAKYCGALLITGNKKHFPKEPWIITPTEFLKICIP